MERFASRNAIRAVVKKGVLVNLAALLPVGGAIYWMRDAGIPRDQAVMMAGVLWFVFAVVVNLSLLLKLKDIQGQDSQV